MFVILNYVRHQELQEIFSKKQITQYWKNNIPNNFHISTKIKEIANMRIHYYSCEC
jgi:hypothetical protein